MSLWICTFLGSQHFQVAVGGIFFPVRSKHRGVGLSGRWKAVNFGANYGEAEGCWQMYCPGEGPAAGSAMRRGAKPLSSSQQARGTREEEDKDVRTSNYTPGTCEIGALEVLVKNDAPRGWGGAAGEGRAQWWEWGAAEEISARPLLMDLEGLPSRDAQNTRAVIYLPKPCLHCNLRCASTSSFKPSLKPLLLATLPIWSVSQSSSSLEKSCFPIKNGMDICWFTSGLDEFCSVSSCATREHTSWITFYCRVTWNLLHKKGACAYWAFVWKSSGMLIKVIYTNLEECLLKIYLHPLRY